MNGDEDGDAKKEEGDGCVRECDSGPKSIRKRLNAVKMVIHGIMGRRVVRHPAYTYDPASLPTPPPHRSIEGLDYNYTSSP